MRVDGKPGTIGAFVASFALIAPLALIASFSLAPSPAHALCGDGNTDGFVTATDALAALRTAVDGGYDDRLDASPAGGDGRLVATDALVVLNAAVGPAIPDCARATTRRLAVNTGDLQVAAGVAVINIATLAFDHRDGALHGDSTIRSSGDRLFGINREGASSLEEIDPNAEGLPLLRECSVRDEGFDTNPYDFLLTDEVGYVSAYNGSDLLVIDPSRLDPETSSSCAGLLVDRIDLSSLADEDLAPEMAQLEMVGNDLFVVLQILEPLGLRPPAGPGKLAVVDTVTRELAGAVVLEISNPFAQTKGIPWLPEVGLLYVGGPGLIFGDFSDGGIEAVDIATRTSAGVRIDGEALGGDLFDFAIAGTRRAFAIVADAASRNLVVEIDLLAGSITRELLVTTAETAEISDLELDERGRLWVAVRDEVGEDTNSGVHGFDIATGQALPGTPVVLPQPPFTLDFLP